MSPEGRRLTQARRWEIQTVPEVGSGAGARNRTGISPSTAGGRTILLRLRWTRPESNRDQAVFSRPLSH